MIDDGDGDESELELAEMLLGDDADITAMLLGDDRMTTVVRVDDRVTTVVTRVERDGTGWYCGVPWGGMG